MNIDDNSGGQLASKIIGIIVVTMVITCVLLIFGICCLIVIRERCMHYFIQFMDYRAIGRYEEEFDDEEFA